MEAATARTSARLVTLCVAFTAGAMGCRDGDDSLTRGCVALDSEQMIPSLEKGELETPPLFDVRGGAVLSDGRVAILNRGTRQLLFFGADGRFLEAVGRKGGGPGEFADPRWLGRGGDDTVFVWDPALARLSIFDGNVFLSSLTPQGAGAPGPSTSIIGRFGDGSFLTRPRGVGFFPSPNGVLRLPESYDRFDPASGTVSHLLDGRSIEWAVGDRGRYTRPFGKEDLAAARGDRLAIGDNGTSTIRVYDLHGQLDRVLEWSSEAAPVTRQDQANFVEYMREEFPRFPLATDLDFPEERPRFSAIAADELGWIWIERYAAEWEPPGPWLVFDERGALRCELRFPERIQLLEIGTTHVLGTRRNDSGEESIVKYTLDRN
jgi:hypothetical protein